MKTEENSLETQSMIFFYGKNTLAQIKNEKLLEELEYAVPGNYNAKIQMLSTINQAYANRDLNNTTAIMLTGSSWVGKSTLVQSISELANIPLIRMDLENLLETSESEKLDLNVLHSELLDVLYDEITSSGKILKKDKLTKEEKLKYERYKKKLPANINEEEILLLREKPNSEFTIIEFDNAEILLDKKHYKDSYSNSLQLALVDQIKNPRIIVPGTRSTANFIYVFSSNLKEAITKKNVGFRRHCTETIDNIKLIDLGYSKKFVEVLDNVIELKDLCEKDFEQYLIREESHLHQCIRGLAKNYQVNIKIDDSAIKVISKYLANSNKNLIGIEEATRKLLAPHYILPKKGVDVVINSTVAMERLYTK
jgi:hypothetical protein